MSASSSTLFFSSLKGLLKSCPMLSQRCYLILAKYKEMQNMPLDNLSVQLGVTASSHSVCTCHPKLCALSL